MHFIAAFNVVLRPVDIACAAIGEGFSLLHAQENVLHGFIARAREVRIVGDDQLNSQLLGYFTGFHAKAQFGFFPMISDFDIEILAKNIF